MLHQQSWLGALLDPLADKVLMFSALSALVLAQRLPLWLWLGILIRDLFLTVVAAAVRYRQIHLDATPSRVGKYATFSLSLLVTLVLIEATLPPSVALHLYVRLLTVVSGLAVAISAVQYFSRFGRLLIPRSSPKTSSAS
jgi:cardiolipin synthase